MIDLVVSEESVRGSKVNRGFGASYISSTQPPGTFSFAEESKLDSTRWFRKRNEASRPEISTSFSRCLERSQRFAIGLKTLEHLEAQR